MCCRVLTGIQQAYSGSLRQPISRLAYTDVEYELGDLDVPHDIGALCVLRRTPTLKRFDTASYRSCANRTTGKGGHGE